MSLQPESLEDAKGVDDYHIIRLGALQQAVRLFSCCGSPLTVSEDRKCRRELVSRFSICCIVTMTLFFKAIFSKNF